MKMCLRIHVFVLVFTMYQLEISKENVYCAVLFLILKCSWKHIYIDTWIHHLYTYWTVLEIYWENMSFLWVLLPPHNFAMFCSRKFTPFFSGFCCNQQIFFQERSLNYTIWTKISLNITHVLFFFDKDKNKQVETYCVN